MHKEQMTQIEQMMEEVSLEVLEYVDFDSEFEGGNDHFFIRPVMGVNSHGTPVAMYGIFNRKTGVMETESRQYEAAKEWVVALTSIKEKQPLPGLSHVTTSADSTH